MMNNDFIFCKMPEVTGKTAPLFLYGEDGASILADRVNFSPVSYDRRRSSDFFHLLVRHAGAVGNIEVENVFLYPSRRFKIVDQESPAWAPSRISISKGKYHHDGDGTILHHDKSLKTRLLKPMDKSFCPSLCFLLLLKQNRIFAGTGIDIFNYTKGEKHFYVCLYILE